MIFIAICILLLYPISAGRHFAMALTSIPLPKVTNIQLPTEEGYRIYQYWTTQAFASLMSAFLQERFSTVPVPDQFTECFFNAQTVPPMAQCIQKLLDDKFPRKMVSKMGKKKWSRRLEIYAKRKKSNLNGKIEFLNDAKSSKKIRKIKWEFAKVKKREVKYPSNDQSDQQNSGFGTGPIPIRSSRPAYSLYDARRTLGMSPIGGVARLLMSGLLGRQNRTRAMPWQESVKKVQELRRVKDQLRKEEQKWQDYVLKKTSIKAGRSKLGFARRSEIGLDEKITMVVRDGIRIGMKMSGQNGTKEEEDYGDEIKARDEADPKTDHRNNGKWGHNGGGRLVDILSPRFLSVTERKSRGKTSNLPLPSLFSLHNNGQGMERALSLPSLMSGGQFTGRDQQEWLDLIMEAAGVNEHTESMKEFLTATAGDGPQEFANKVEKRYKREFKGLYLSKENVREMFGRYEERKLTIWEKLERALTNEQWASLNKSGMATLNSEQLKFFYGPNSPYNNSEALSRLLPIVQNCSSTSKLIQMDIPRLAQMHSFDLRHNDVLLSPSLFRPAIRDPKRTSQPIILSPIVFSPTILSPTIMGPAILSPRVFSPPILSPRIMTPLILSPFIFSLIILTPIIMQPFILSPGFLNSAILSPYTLNPMVLSPQFLHPFVLSPLVLSPGVANPGALSPLVLSPFVLSPQIFSPKAFSGIFLSPYALSPVFMSPVYFYLVVLSPSWLS